MQASVAHTPDQNRKKKVAAVLFGAIILTGVLVAFLLITLTNLNKPKITGKKATTIPVSAGPSCPAGGAHCTWTYGNAEDVTFKYTITDQTTNLIEATGETSSTSISFTPKPDHVYTCTVIAVNDCGESSAQTGKNTCVTTLMSPTPSPTLPPGVTPSITPTPTKGPSPTPSPTLPPGVTPSITPTPTKGLSPTPSPTLPPGVTPSATPTPTNRPGTTPGVTEIVIVITTTPQPTGTTSTTIIVQQPTVTSVPPTAGALLPSIALIGMSVFIIILGLVL